MGPNKGENEAMKVQNKAIMSSARDSGENEMRRDVIAYRVGRATRGCGNDQTVANDSGHHVAIT